MSARDAANTARLAAAKQDKAAAARASSAAKAAASVSPSKLAAKESGAIGAASIASQLKAAQKKPSGTAATTSKPTTTSTTTKKPTTTTKPTTTVTPTVTPAGRTVVSTYVDQATGDTFAVYTDGTTELLSQGTRLADEAAEQARLALTAQQEAARAFEERKREGQSAYSLLLSEFDRYGLTALVEPLKKFIEEGLSPAEFTLRLRETDAYKKRFAANAQRVAKGLRALSEAEYIGTEDQYQDVMRRYGMPESYYAKGDLGVQSGFEKFLAGDVSAVELEDRIQTAQNRVVNSNPEVAKALKEFYPGISNGDILSYVLDPTNAIENIKRKVTAAEIGGAAIQSGLQTGMSRAEELRAAGVTKQTAQQGFGTIAGGLQRGSQLASIYGEDPYSQAVAETEVFGLAGSEKARKQRQKITGLEKATFGGQTGLTTGALSQERAGAF